MIFQFGTCQGIDFKTVYRKQWFEPINEKNWEDIYIYIYKGIPSDFLSTSFNQLLEPQDSHLPLCWCIMLAYH